MKKLAKIILVAIATLTFNCSWADTDSRHAQVASQEIERIAPYSARFGRTRPLVAVVGENSSTVLSDYVIPYGALAQSGVADVVSLATKAGPLHLPPVQIKPDSTVASFDARYPEGADYVVVPAVMKRDDPLLIAWVKAQAMKGATMISICNGSIVLANAGLTSGHRATGHWSTMKSPATKRAAF